MIKNYSNSWCFVVLWLNSYERNRNFRMIADVKSTRIPFTIFIFMLIFVMEIRPLFSGIEPGKNRGLRSEGEQKVIFVKILETEGKRTLGVFTVEVANTPQAMEKGLMYRSYIPKFGGMLFIFPDSDLRSFWMKNTLTPLDMIFADEQKRIVTIHENVPPCPPVRVNCPTYSSEAPTKFVLEIRGGMAKDLGVEKGDFLSFSQ